MTPPDRSDRLDLEQELRQALRRMEPQRDFSTISYPTPRRWMPTRGLLALAAAVVLMVSVPIGVKRYEARRERREEAREELIKALQITRNKIEKTRQMVVRQLDRRNSI